MSLSRLNRPVEYKWDKKDEVLPPQAKVDGAYLRFESLNKSDNGVYLCYADNGIGNSQGEYTLLVQGNKERWTEGNGVEKDVFFFYFSSSRCFISVAFACISSIVFLF